MCNVLWGVPGCVTKFDRGRRSQNWPKLSVTYFMDGPKWGSAGVGAKAALLFVILINLIDRPDGSL